MASPRRLGARRLGVLLLIALGAPAEARAWTDAQVQTVTAFVDLAPTAQATVRLELHVAVRGGWLEELEIAGLDPDLELDPATPVTFVSEVGARYAPRVSSGGDGRVLLRFPRHAAPRRGRYVAQLRYRTDLAHRATEPVPGGFVRVAWTLPGWRSGLDGVAIHLTAPAGAHALDAETAGPATVQHAHAETGGRALLSWRRAHLPRTVPWTVAVDVPEDAMDPLLRSEAPRLAPRSDAPRAAGAAPAETGRAGVVLALLLGSLLLAKSWAYPRECARAGVQPRPLVPLRSRTRGSLIFGAASGAALAFASFPSASLGLLALAVTCALERTPGPPAPPGLGGFRAAARDDLRAADRARIGESLSLLAALDATSLLGVVTCATAVTAVCRAAPLDGPLLASASPAVFPGLLLFVPTFLNATRHQLPASPARRLRSLRRWAEGLRLPLEEGSPGIALGLAVHADAQGAWQDARVRLATAHRLPGLVRLDVTLAERRGLGGLSAVPVLLVVTRAASPAETAVAAVAAESPWRNAPGGRRARVVPLDAGAYRLVAALASEPGSPVTDAPPEPSSTAAAGTARGRLHEPLQ